MWDSILGSLAVAEFKTLESLFASKQCWLPSSRVVWAFSGRCSSSRLNKMDQKLNIDDTAEQR